MIVNRAYIKGCMIFAAVLFWTWLCCLFAAVKTSAAVTEGRGDINGDGNISTVDIMMCVSYVKGTSSPDAAKKEMADINGDGKLNTTDIMLMIGVVNGRVKINNVGSIVLGTQAVTSDHILLTWDKAVGAKQYEVSYKSWEEGAYKGPFTVSSNSYIIQNTQKNTRYDIMIRGVNGDKAGITKSFSVTTLVPEFKPEMNYSASENAVIVSWNRLESCQVNGQLMEIKGYQSAYKDEGAFGAVMTHPADAGRRIYGVEGNKYFTAGLRCFVTLDDLDVKVNCFSDYAQLTCLAAPKAAADIKVHTTSDSAKVSWSAPEGGCGSYRLFMKSGVNWTAVADISGDKTEYTVTGLENGKEYSFQIMTYTKATGSGVVSYGYWSDMVSCFTDVVFEGYDGLILVGDSRTYHISQIEGITEIYDDTLFISKAGTGYLWLASDAVPELEKKLSDGKRYIVVFNHGVNDTSLAQDYMDLYTRLIEKYGEDHLMLFMTVDPVVDGGKLDDRLGRVGAMNQVIGNFNRKMQTVWGDNILDMNSYLMETGYDTIDSLHYTTDTYVKIYHHMLEMLQERLARDGQ